MKILVLNCGSSSLKFQLIDMEDEQLLAKGNFERIGDNSFISYKINGEKTKIEHPVKDHTEAISMVLDILLDPKNDLIKSVDEIGAIGHRIVSGGEYFAEPELVTEDVIKKIEICSDLAPLHNPAHVAGIRAAEEVFPGVPMVVVFDTAFHQTMEPKAYMYNLPYRYYEDYKIRKYGAHGTSHEYVAKRAAEIMGRENDPDFKVVTCHIGQGASISAVKGGKCMDTSMGLTPLAGIPMATRCGDIDPAIVPFVMKKEKLTPEQMDKIMNKESGAYGLSCVSPDYRDIEEAAANGDEKAILALDSQGYKIAQYIGQFMMTLGGLDAVVFTGGVGENGVEARERVVEYLEFLGTKLDKEANNKRGDEIMISTPDSKVPVYVIPTNEELMIARKTQKIVNEVK